MTKTSIAMKLLSAALLVGVTQSSTLGRRFTDQGNPTGPTDPNVISDCTYWTLVQSGDTCKAIETYYGISQAQFISYNPSLAPSCASLTVGNSYCVEENYGRAPATSSSKTSSSKTSVPATSSPKTIMSVTSSATMTTGTAPAPTQSGLTSDCKSYYKVMSGDGCQSIVDMYGTFTLSDFYGWNPAVGNDCHNLLAGYYVCVGTSSTPTTRPAPSTPASSGPAPEQTGIVSGCTNYYKVQTGDGCQSIVDQYGTFSLDQFYSWNPAVGGQCQSLQAGYYVCVGIASTPTTRPTSPVPSSSGPSPEQTGIISSCVSYYMAQSGDSCSAIANQYGTFTTAQFISWNPAVQSDCSQLFVGYYYCVGIPSTPTTRSSATPTPTPSGPQPQEPGTISSCKTYYLVQSGDSCYDIEQAKGITADQFNTWNPNVGSDCSKLYAGYYICVAA